jgi:hypothetical protein
MNPVRSEGWSVHPSFVPNGPTTPVTLLIDDTGLTQLAGEPPVAWQTPWAELSNIQLRRFKRGMALFATAGGVRYCWRRRDLDDYDLLGNVVRARGGQVTFKRRRTATLVVVIVVLLASVAGGIGAFFARGSSGSRELADARAVNLTLKDLPSGFSVAGQSVLSDLFSRSTQVVTSAPTTALPANSLWDQIAAKFQGCMGVSSAKDRVYGSAGQMPDYQVSSEIFGSTSLEGVEVASTTQYYASTTMVSHDLTEMSQSQFGACFASTNAALILSSYGGGVASVPAGTNWRPVTFVRGWSRAGVENLSLPGVPGPLHLVMVVVASGHYEVTMGAIVASLPKTKLLLANLTNTLLSRISSTSSSAA